MRAFRSTRPTGRGRGKSGTKCLMAVASAPCRRFGTHSVDGSTPRHLKMSRSDKLLRPCRLGTGVLPIHAFQGFDPRSPCARSRCDFRRRPTQAIHARVAGKERPLGHTRFRSCRTGRARQGIRRMADPRAARIMKEGGAALDAPPRTGLLGPDFIVRQLRRRVLAVAGLPQRKQDPATDQRGGDAEA